MTDQRNPHHLICMVATLVVSLILSAISTADNAEPTLSTVWKRLIIFQVHQWNCLSPLCFFVEVGGSLQGKLKKMRCKTVELQLQGKSENLMTGGPPRDLESDTTVVRAQNINIGASTSTAVEAAYLPVVLHAVLVWADHLGERGGSYSHRIEHGASRS